jgi:hypothetical protein
MATINVRHLFPVLFPPPDSTFSLLVSTYLSLPQPRRHPRSPNITITHLISPSTTTTAYLTSPHIPSPSPPLPLTVLAALVAIFHTPTCPSHLQPPSVAPKLPHTVAPSNLLTPVPSSLLSPFIAPMFPNTDSLIQIPQLAPSVFQAHRHCPPNCSPASLPTAPHSAPAHPGGFLGPFPLMCRLEPFADNAYWGRRLRPQASVTSRKRNSFEPVHKIFE